MMVIASDCIQGFFLDPQSFLLSWWTSRNIRKQVQPLVPGHWVSTAHGASRGFLLFTGDPTALIRVSMEASSNSLRRSFLPLYVYHSLSIFLSIGISGGSADICIYYSSIPTDIAKYLTCTYCYITCLHSYPSLPASCSRSKKSS